ncbi:hypothetical protein [Bradyrhizobium sp. CCBAU 51765]|uniref:hypothetical protein n=1 Tax=Bradyrhizobium sp. CCBAU 51765 TaxID=1325102 RepID=UPI001886BB3B|nr:hypothetical protein [Bradyrhizobium sp. CCBAU 51765]QOZ09539.1 hypothetical protein XH96_19875 [Bradyrhizobium sp. CCBAU 51765]
MTNIIKFPHFDAAAFEESEKRHKRREAAALAINRTVRRHVLKGVTLAEMVAELRLEAETIEAVGIADLPSDIGGAAV